jgi:hypothetical protein
MIEWMSPLNFFQRQVDVFNNWQPGTGYWLLASPEFKDWETSTGEVLWCRGIREFCLRIPCPVIQFFLKAGAGKTVLACVSIKSSVNKLTTMTLDLWS